MSQSRQSARTRGLVSWGGRRFVISPEEENSYTLKRVLGKNPALRASNRRSRPQCRLGKAPREQGSWMNRPWFGGRGGAEAAAKACGKQNLVWGTEKRLREVKPGSGGCEKRLETRRPVAMLEAPLYPVASHNTWDKIPGFSHGLHDPQSGLSLSHSSCLLLSIHVACLCSSICHAHSV